EMIIELILNIFIGGFSLLLDLLPTIDINLPQGFMSWLLDIFEMSGYFLPIGDFLAMMGIWFLVVNFHIIWKLIQRIWDSLPLV
ncbi:MAG TPA: hypothetical protein VEV44_16290, partial [Pseudoneobacillus sp.]|nr:hypothetical protein [Pseudoneobacillus sp.]